MAEALGVAASLIAVVTVTAQSTKILYETVQSFKTHRATVLQLYNELEALGKVLESLKDHVATDDSIFLPLKFPLRQCGRACQDFKHEIDKRIKHSSSSGTSFRDWARLSYMSSSIGDFTTMLAGYKSTIIIALADANLYAIRPMQRDCLTCAQAYRQGDFTGVERLQRYDPGYKVRPRKSPV